MSEPPRSRKRGRPPRAVAARPTGYRATDEVLDEIRFAAAFLRIGSQQDLIDRAVRDFLQRERRNNSLYATAAAAFDEQRVENPENVAPLRAPYRGR